MNKILILRGLPGSSKSTWAKELLGKEPNKWKRVNKDEIRAMLDNSVYSPENEELVNYVQESIIRKALRNGLSVINDNTNLPSRVFLRMCDLAKDVGDVQVEEKIFDVDIEECIRRDSLRTGIAKVGEQVIRDMHNRYLRKGFFISETKYFPNIENAYEIKVIEQNKDLPPCCIVDIDGTIALLHNRSPYDTDKSINDLPNQAVVDYIKAVYFEHDYKIIFVTGREEKYRDITVAWLDKHLSWMESVDERNSNDKKYLVKIPYELYMRPTEDKTKDTIYKKDIYDNFIKNKYRVVAVLEDRRRCAEMYRDLGFIVFQLNNKEF